MTTGATTGIRHVWPYPDIVKLNAHAGSGQWRKMHAGRDYYFGTLDDPDKALAEWRAHWPTITSGRGKVAFVPQGESAAAVSVHSAFNAFLIVKKTAMARGEIAWPTFTEYQSAVRTVCDAVGKTLPLGALGPERFERVMAAISHLSPIKRGNTVTKIKTATRWVAKKYAVPIDFGDDFRGPPMRLRRLQRNQRMGRVYTPGQVHALLDAAKGDDLLTAVLLLGINGGYSNHDLASTLTADFKPGPGWIEHLREKTAAMRRVPLWPETVEALNKAVDPGRELLLVAPSGLKLVRRGRDEVQRMFAGLRDKAGVGGTFRWLRYTFSTVASQLPGEDHARDIIMGHVIDGVPENYVINFPEKRLVDVVTHVRSWLWPRRADGRGRKQGPPRAR